MQPASDGDFLSDVAAGTTREPCSIRSGDELQDLCRLVNAATEQARAGALRKAG